MNRLTRIRRSIAVLAVALVISSIALVSTVLASDTGTVFQVGTSSCAGYIVNNSACFKEDINGGGDQILVVQGIGSSADNLGAKSVTVGDGKCNGGIFNNSTWNDCLSWIGYSINSGEQICVFRDAGFGGGVLWSQSGPISGGSHTFTGSENDNISSISIEHVGGGFC